MTVSCDLISTPMAQWALLSFHTRGRRCSETSNDLLRFRSWPGGHGAAPGGLSLEPAVLAGPRCSPTSQQSHLCSHQPPSVYSALGCALLVSEPSVSFAVPLKMDIESSSSCLPNMSGFCPQSFFFFPSEQLSRCALWWQKCGTKSLLKRQFFLGIELKINPMK